MVLRGVSRLQLCIDELVSDHVGQEEDGIGR